MPALLNICHPRTQVFESNKVFFRIEIYRYSAFLAFLNSTF